MSLRGRAEEMGDVMTPPFGQKRMKVLLPVLDEFVSVYRGEVKHFFRQSMVKFIECQNSGQSSSISGWINVFYPYLSSGSENKYLRPWQKLIQTDGSAPEKFPQVISSAPVEWDYLGRIKSCTCTLVITVQSRMRRRSHFILA